MRKFILFILVMFLVSGLFAQSKSLNFNAGDDRVSATDFSSLGQTYTIEGWIKFPTLTWGDEYHLWEFSDDAQEDQFYVLGDNGVAYMIANRAGGSQNYIALNYNTWYHIAYVRTPTTLTVYVDGVVDISGAVAGGAVGALAQLNLGHYRTGASYDTYSYLGLMDEVRVWSTARTSAEINANKDNELVGNEAGLFAYYNFNGESGTTLTDRTSGGRNGTLYNMNTATAWVTDTAPLPVELTSFTASAVDGSVLLNWETATEVNNYGFDVESSVDGESFSVVGFVEGHGNSNTPQSYSLTATDGAKYYRLKQLDTDGGFEYSEVVEVEGSLVYKLAQNYPNPFNPTTAVTFSLPQAIRANISIYNTLGQKVMEVADRDFSAGTHSVSIDASQLSSGMYFYKLETSNFSKSMKMMLLK